MNFSIRVSQFSIRLRVFVGFALAICILSATAQSSRLDREALRAPTTRLVVCGPVADKTCDAWVAANATTAMTQLRTWHASRGEYVLPAPWDAPMAFAGAVPTGNGEVLWQWRKVGPASKPCTPAQLASGYSRKACTAKIGDILLQTQRFRFEVR
jgi:hypothetical protein